jgi:hypothetical protein
MQRTVDDYDAMARREVISVKQEKAQSCVHPRFGAEKGL